MAEQTIETREMTFEDLQAHERAVQLGETDIMLDGRTIKEVQEANIKMQKEQEDAIQATSVEVPPSPDSETFTVSVAENGVVIASPSIDPAAAERAAMTSEDGLRADLGQKSKAELIELAHGRNVEFEEKQTKAEIIEAIVSNRQA